MALLSGFDRTSILQVAVRPEERSVAVIVAVPDDIAVTTPRLLTEATKGLSLSKIGCSIDVFGFMIGFRRKRLSVFRRIVRLGNLILKALGVTLIRHFNRRITFFPFFTVAFTVAEPMDTALMVTRFPFDTALPMEITSSLVDV